MKQAGSNGKSTVHLTDPQPDGRPLPQTSNSTVIAAMLRLSDAAPGSHVLEIGTGSGYSTALLSYLVGPSGSVTSLDVDAGLVQRAQYLLTQQGITNATVIAADGQKGCPVVDKPFDRIIAWATADCLPDAWAAQWREGGIIVAPMQLNPIAHTTAVVRLRRQGEQIVGEQVISGAFVPLTSTAFFNWGKAPKEADIVTDGSSDPAAWISSTWLKKDAAEAHKPHLRHLCSSLATGSSLLSPQEDADALRAYLIASCPHGLTTAFLPLTGRAIGCSTPDSMALLSLHDKTLAEAGSNAATQEMEHWVERWRAYGQPGFEQLKPIAKKTLRGWTIRVRLEQV